ncbi:hypothetical protein GEMRC1_005192 [Eukaryota sp. GEM-RC1]
MRLHLLLAISLLFAVGFAKFQYLDTILSASSSSEVPDSRYISLPNWFTQRLDHFNDLDKRVWAQRYYMNQRFWDGKGPIFMYIGGEGTLSGPPGDDSFVGSLAKEHNGLIVALEHRFYGMSQPFINEKRALRRENLEYLNSRQALGDLAHFLSSVKTNLTKSTGHHHKVISVGGSYPGALSSHFRLKYPHLVDFAISSSGVVRSLANFPEFDASIAKAVGTVCAEQLRKVTHLFEEKMKTKKGIQECKDVFKLDSGYRDDDIWFLLADSQIIPTQYGQKHRLCKILGTLDGDDLFKAYKKYARDIFMGEHEPNGLGEYDTRHLAKEEFVPDLSNSRCWYWQSCNELGWLQSAPSKKSNQIFKNDF